MRLEETDLDQTAIVFLRIRWPSRAMVRETAGYSAESVIRLLLTAIVGVLVARYLGPDGLGLLSYASAVFALLAPLTMLGMRPVLVREFSTREDWQVVLASALGRQLPVALLVTAVGFGVVTLTRGFERDATLIAVALLPLPILATGDTLRALFEATRQVRLIVLVGVSAIVTSSLVKVAAVALEAPIWVFAAATSLDGLVVLVGLLSGLRARKTPRAALRRFDSETASALLRESWPLIIAGLAVMLYMRADIVMLGLLADDETTGVYVAAARLSEAWYFLPVAAMAAARPRLARLYADAKSEEYHSTSQQFMTAAFVASALAIVVTLILGEWLIELLYGRVFLAASDVLRIHILAAPFVFLGVAASQWFVDRGMTRAVMVRSTLGAGVNIALNLVLIPVYGAMGAAISTLVAYAAAGFLFNGASRNTRPVFMMQLRAMALRRR